MELDEMKAAWSQMSAHMAHQQRLTDSIILKMTHEKSNSRLGRIVLLEGFGVIISIIALAYLSLNFYKLIDWLEITGGIVTISILVIAIGFGINLILNAKQINLTKLTISETLKRFEAFKKLLGFYKKLSIVTNIISVIFIIPVALALFTDKHILDDPTFGIYPMLGGVILTPILLYLIIKFYKSNISTVSHAFKDLEK